jgi:1-acyl-sn-glycerol-3-phosphate acyltransferase
MQMMFRNFLFYLGIVPVTIILTVLGWLLFFTPLSVRYWIITRWSHFFIFWAKTTCGLDFTVEGLENIPKKNAIVFSNHQSMWETIFFQVLLPNQTWVLKKELLYIPIFGWGLALIEPIAINRKEFNSIRSLIRQGKERLAKGRWVIIFPEGTRVSPGENRDFTRSGAALAQASEYPILPVAHNAGYFWPRGFCIKKPGIIRVAIGPLIETKGKTTDEINAAAERWIKDKLPMLAH